VVKLDRGVRGGVRKGREGVRRLARVLLDDVVERVVDAALVAAALLPRAAAELAALGEVLADDGLGDRASCGGKKRWSAQCNEA
jgi:hypothetical protein